MQLKFFKINIKKNNIKKENFQPNPNLYWKIILYTIFLLILISFAFGFYFFTRTNKEMISLDENIKKQSEIVQKDRIEKVLEYFSERENKSAIILNSASPVVDPSL